MCGVIGVALHDVTPEDLEMVREVFIESRIRGLHATGLSVLHGGKITTIRKAGPPEDLIALNRLHEYVDEGTLYLIGHNRYSTSDILYNQPFHNSANDFALAHNGVISQEDPSTWYDQYGYVAQTKNDSELLMLTVLAGKDPFVEWKDASIAAVELRANRSLRFYRNGKRPLYLTSKENGVIITSTKDIMSRVLPGSFTESVQPGTFFTIDDTLSMIFENSEVNIHDLQTAHPDYRQSLFS